MALRHYEGMFLLDSGKYAQDPQGTEQTVLGFLQKCGAEVVVHTPWQDGKLAYEIDGHKKGLHYLTYFKMDGSEVTNLNRMCKLSDVVVRQLILEHEPKLFTLMIEHLSDARANATADAESFGSPA